MANYTSSRHERRRRGRQSLEDWQMVSKRQTTAANRTNSRKATQSQKIGRGWHEHTAIPADVLRVSPTAETDQKQEEM